MRILRALAAICVPLILTMCPVLGGQTPDVAGQVDRAARLLLSPGVTDQQCRDGLVSLLDAIIAVGPDTRVDGAWKSEVAAARDLAAGGRFLGDDTVRFLNDSYRAVHGKAFKMPPAVRSMPEAREYIRERLSSVRSLLDSGQPDEAVRRMLEAAVMIVTPRQA